MLRLKLSPLNRRLLFTDSGGSAPLDSDYLAWKARVIQIGGNVQPDEELRINDAIVKQKADGNFEENDRQWVHCVSNINAAIVSLNNPLSNPLALINGVGFSPYEGFQGDGLTQYIDTQFNPNVDGVKYTLNSASFGVYSLDSPSYLGFHGGYLGGSQTWIGNNGFLAARINEDGIETTSIVPSSGLFVGSRETSVLKKIYLNGISESINYTVTSVMNQNLFLLCRNQNGIAGGYSTNKLAFSCIGSGAIDQASFYDSIKPLVDGAETELYRGLIAGYNLNGDATSATGQYNGTPTNITYLSGKKGLAASFNGTTSKIAIGRPLNKAVGTVSFWVNSNFLLNNIGRPISDSFGNLYFEISAPNIVKFNLYDNSLKELSTTFLLDTWVNIVGVYDGTNIKLYKNGGFINQTPAGAIESVNYDCFLGTNGSAPTTFFNGLLDMVGFWNRPLTPEEITILYNNGNGALKSNK